VVKTAEARLRDDLAHLGRLKPSMLKGHRPRMSQKGRPGERGNLNQLRHLCLHSETLWTSGEAQKFEFGSARKVRSDLS
jgi:hypothetical protein